MVPPLIHEEEVLDSIVADLRSIGYDEKDIKEALRAEVRLLLDQYHRERRTRKIVSALAALSLVALVATVVFGYGAYVDVQGKIAERDRVGQALGKERGDLLQLTAQVERLRQEAAEIALKSQAHARAIEEAQARAREKASTGKVKVFRIDKKLGPGEYEYLVDGWRSRGSFKNQEGKVIDHLLPGVSYEMEVTPGGVAQVRRVE